MLAHPIAVSPDVDDVAVVHQTIDQCGRHDVIAEDLAPLREAFVGRQHRRRALLPARDHLEEEHGPSARDGQIPNLVYNEQTRKTLFPHLPHETTPG